MLRLPDVLCGRYRLATAREVHSWSFGLLKAVRDPSATGWGERVGTLDDERIFGPKTDFECTCGKYQGTKHKGMICDRCGVKVTTARERRKRCGHIDLAEPVAHPLGDESDTVTAVPVLPAVLVESSGGQGLAKCYEDLIQAVKMHSQNRVVAALQQMVDCLVPVVTAAHEWGLVESLVLARGLILELQEQADA